MAKIASTPPKVETQLVEVKNPSFKHRRFYLFRTSVEQLGFVEYQARYSWVAEDGTVLRDADAAADYLKRTSSAGRQVIGSGTEYEVHGFESVTQTRDRVVIKTASGDVVIHLAAARLPSKSDLED